MQHRLRARRGVGPAAAVAATVALATATPTVHSAFTSDARPGAARFAAAAQFPPRVVTPPSISGTPRQGSTLTGSDGTWARGVDHTSGLWLRDGVVVGTGATRVLQDGDVGRRLVYRVTATNAAGSTSADSVASAVILGPVPQNTARPSISSSATVGSVLTAHDGAWSGGPTAFAYRWIRCAAGTCRSVEDVTEHQLLLTGDDAGATFAVEVTATNSGGSASAISSATDTVARATYSHALCRNPDDGAYLGEDGALPRGLAFARNTAAFPSPAAATRCATGDGVPLSTGGTWSTTLADAGGWLQYRTTDDVEFAGATLFRRGTTSGGFGWTVRTATATTLAAAPRAELCSSTAGCLSRGTALDPFGDANRLAVAPGAVNGFDVALLCDPPPGGTCAADGTQTFQLLSGDVVLRDVSTPQVTKAPTGGLVTDPALDGIESLAFTATDAGAGLYRVRVRIGTEEVAASALEADPGRCTDIDPGDGDPYEFDHRRPCPLSLAVDLRFDTTGWPETGRLRVLLEDAGRNTTLLVNRPLGG